MADIKNKNELKRRIDLFMDELDYSINEEFCKETMTMMREFIGRASHLLDCADAKINKAKRTARNDAIDEFSERLKNKLVLRYGNATPTEQYVAMQVTEWCNEIADEMRGAE